MSCVLEVAPRRKESSPYVDREHVQTVETTIAYWGYIGIMEKKMEISIVYMRRWCSAIGVICKLGLRSR